MEGVVPVIKMLACFDSVRIFYIFSMVVQSNVKRGFRLSDILYFAEHTFTTEGLFEVATESWPEWGLNS